MAMVTVRTSGITYVTYNLTGFNLLPRAYRRSPLHMGTNRRILITLIGTVINHNPVAKAACIIACRKHNAIGNGYNGLALNAGTCNINAAVKPSPTLAVILC